MLVDAQAGAEELRGRMRGCGSRAKRCHRAGAWSPKGKGRGGRRGLRQDWPMEGPGRYEEWAWPPLERRGRGRAWPGIGVVSEREGRGL